MLARELMTEEVLTVHPDHGFNRVEIMAELKHVRHVPVINEESELVGIVSIRDLLGHLSNAAASHFAPICEVMSKELVTAAPDADIKEVARLMREKQVGCVPIVDSGKLVGLISERDFLALIEKL